MELTDGIITLNEYELAIFDHSYNSVVITTPFLEGEHPKILYVNNAFTKMSGYTKEEIVGKTPRILQGEKTDKEVLNRLKECLKNGEYFEGNTINYTKDGREYLVEWNISPVYDQGKNLIAFVSLQKDISLPQKFLNHIKLFQKAIDQNSDSIALFSPKGEYIYVNKSYTQRTGFDPKELIGKNPKILKSGEHDKNFYKHLWNNLLNKRAFETTFCNKNADGKLYYEKQTITPILENNELIGFIATGKNYDNEQKLNKQLQEDVFIDDLTKLFNKKAFVVKYRKAIQSYTKEGKSFSMIFIDLDNFKQVNDTMGHDEGDDALKSCANFLKEYIRKSDDIFRFGGDEFIVLLYDIKEQEASAFCEKLEKLFLNSTIAKKYNIGMSIGCKHYSGEDGDKFFKEIDKRMYNKKREKKSNNQKK